MRFASMVFTTLRLLSRRFAYVSAALLLSLSACGATGTLASKSALSSMPSPQHCENVAVQILGSGGPELDDNRASSAYLVWHNNTALALVDAGSGSSIQFGTANAAFDDLDIIVLSHLHTDHAADLPSFIKGSYFGSRTRNLPIIGPKGNDLMPSTEHYVNALMGEQGAFRYLSSYTQPKQDDYTLIPISVTEPTFNYEVNPSLEVSAIDVDHGPIPALAWKINIEGCTIVFSGDTNDADATLANFASNADLLVLHNAINSNAGTVAKNLHMTPAQLIDIAVKSKAKRVVLSHIMKRSEKGLNALKNTIFAATNHPVYAAQDLMMIQLSE